MILSESQQKSARNVMNSIQRDLSQALENIDGKAKFDFKDWTRPEGGGGRIGVVRGEVVEKAGVNVSEVFGEKYPAIEGEYAGKPFYAVGVSTITHMYNPNAPIGHMNIRVLSVGDTFWVGGGADLTPFEVFPEDTADFHGALRRACRSEDEYKKFSAWCDEYFYIPHRKSVRGVGGIFFDYLKGDFNEQLKFIEGVARAYTETFPKILARRKDLPFTAEKKDAQLYWRGRYAEFNLAYDRGTRFGFMSGGNTEAILVSLPPIVKW